jgi:AcrR family transcriptional regulator
MVKGMNDKLNQERWLGAGLQVLAEEGPEGLRIMPIAQKLGVTKGSFYWHYRNLDDYQSALLEEWELRHTRQVIHHVEGKGGDALAKLRNLVSISFNADARLAQAIRRWAITNPQALDAQARVDHDRLAYLVSLLRPLGWSQAKAEFLARWLYGALIGYFGLQGPAVGAVQLDLIMNMLTPPPKSAAINSRKP